MKVGREEECEVVRVWGWGERQVGEGGGNKGGE